MSDTPSRPSDLSRREWLAAALAVPVYRAWTIPGLTFVQVTDFWTGASLGRMTNRLTLENMPPHSARLLECVNV